MLLGDETGRGAVNCCVVASIPQEEHIIIITMPNSSASSSSDPWRNYGRIRRQWLLQNDENYSNLRVHPSTSIEKYTQLVHQVRMYVFCGRMHIAPSVNHHLLVAHLVPLPNPIASSFHPYSSMTNFALQRKIRTARKSPMYWAVVSFCFCGTICHSILRTLSLIHI